MKSLKGGSNSDRSESKIDKRLLENLDLPTTKSNYHLEAIYFAFYITLQIG
jgi:hypothetical protein